MQDHISISLVGILLSGCVVVGVSLSSESKAAAEIRSSTVVPVATPSPRTVKTKPVQSPRRAQASRRGAVPPGRTETVDNNESITRRRTDPRGTATNRRTTGTPVVNGATGSKGTKKPVKRKNR